MPDIASFLQTIEHVTNGRAIGPKISFSKFIPVDWTRHRSTTTSAYREGGRHGLRICVPIGVHEDSTTPLAFQQLERPLARRLTHHDGGQRPCEASHPIELFSALQRHGDMKPARPCRLDKRR